MRFYFLELFKVHSRIQGKVQRFPIHLLLHTGTASPIFNVPHQRGTSVITDEPTLSHHYHPKSTVYMRVHSWWCTFYGFGQTHDDTYSEFRHHTEYFHCSKKPSVHYKHCQVCSPVALRAFTLLCKHHHHPPPELFHHPGARV